MLERLEFKLATARRRVNLAAEALKPKHKGGEWEEFTLAYEDLLSAERELAAYQGIEFADELEFPIRWDVGAPMPHVLMNDSKVLLMFFVQKVDPNWDGSYVRMRDVRSDLPVAIVEFDWCISAKLGLPNDEAIEGHRLYGKGLSTYRAHQVRNSIWISDLEKANSVHPEHKGRWHEIYQHYIFCFHESTFECIAKNYKAVIQEASMPEVLSAGWSRLNASR